MDGAEIVAHTLKSTAWILVALPQSKSLVEGSGFLVNAQEKLVITNFHVVYVGKNAQGVQFAREAEVFFPEQDKEGKNIHDPNYYLKKPDRGKRKAQVLAVNQQRDLALLRLHELPPGVQALPLAKSSASAGQKVHSLGNPGVSRSVFVHTEGSVRAPPIFDRWESAIGRDRLPFAAKILEIQSSTNPGDSGGPVVNDQGELVAVTQGSIVRAKALDIAIDVSEVRDFLQSQKFAWVEGTGPAGKKPDKVLESDLFKVAEFLKHPREDYRLRAAEILAEVGPDSKIVLAGLRQSLLKDESSPVRRMAAHALGEMAKEAYPAIADLLLAMKDPQREVKLQAVKSIAKIGPKGSPAAVDALGAILGERDREFQEFALKVLAAMGPEAEKTLPALQKILHGPERTLRALALEVLEGMGPAALTAAPALQKLLKAADNLEKTRILRVLIMDKKEAEKIAKQFTPLLILNLEDADKFVRFQSLKTLEKLGPGAREAVPKVVFAYQRDKDKERQNGLQALKTLAAIGKDAFKAVSPLVEDLKNPSLLEKEKELYDQVCQTLGKIAKNKDGVAAVLRVALDLKNTKPGCRLHALQVLGDIGPEAKLALEPLKTRLTAQDIRNRETHPEVEKVLRATIEKLKNY